MAKRYDEPIEVTADLTAGAVPVAFAWRGRRYEIDQHLTSWREGAARSHAREFYRVLARPAGALATGELDADGFMTSPSAVYDITFDRLRRCWCLARIWD